MVKEFDTTKTSTTNRNVKQELRATAARWAVSNRNLDTIPAERNPKRELAGNELKHVSGGAVMAYAYLKGQRKAKWYVGDVDQPGSARYSEHLQGIASTLRAGFLPAFNLRTESRAVSVISFARQHRKYSHTSRRHYLFFHQRGQP